MNALKIVAAALIVCGVLGLVYGGFSYTRSSHEASVGPVKLSIEEKKTVNLPVWAGVAAIAAGAVLLLVTRKR